MKRINKIVLLFIVALLLISCGGGGGGSTEETEEIINNLIGTKWYFYDNQRIDNYSSIIVEDGKTGIRFSQLRYHSNRFSGLFDSIGDRYNIGYEFKPYGSSQELEFSLEESLVVEGYAAKLSGRIIRDFLPDGSGILSDDSAPSNYATMVINIETYVTKTEGFEFVLKGAHSDNPFIGTKWESGAGKILFFKNDKVCLLDGVELEYWLTTVFLEESGKTLFFIASKDSYDNWFYPGTIELEGSYINFNDLTDIMSSYTRIN